MITLQIRKTAAHRGEVTVLPKELRWKLRTSWLPAVVWMLSYTRMVKPGWQLMPVYVAVFRTAPNGKEPLQRCSIDTALCISLSALPDFPGGPVKNLPAMQGTWILSLGQEDPPEKWMATHSSTLAWRIPWTEEADGHEVTKRRTWLSNSTQTTTTTSALP